MRVDHTSGKNLGEIMLFGLTTCPWCHKARQLLDNAGVEYDYIDVDLTDGPERERILKRVKLYSPRLSLPLMLINGKPIVRYHEDEIRESLRIASAARVSK